MDRIDAAQTVVEVPLDAQPLDFLLAVFRDSGQPMNRRVKAAEISAKYCHAQLSAIAVHQAGDDFGMQLERAISASNRCKAGAEIDRGSDAANQWPSSEPRGSFICPNGQELCSTQTTRLEQDRFSKVPTDRR